MDFGGSAGTGTGTTGAASPPPSASAPTDGQIAAGADKSTIGHHGHGDDAGRSAEPSSRPAPDNAVAADGSSKTVLAETGGSGSTPYLAVGGAAALALGSGALFMSVRRRAHRH